MSIRVFIVDDRELIHAGVREFFRGTDIKIVGEATVIEAADRLAELDKQPLVILGFEPPESDGVALLEQLRTGRPRPQVMLYAARRSAEMITRGLSCEATGIVLHEANRDQFLQSVVQSSRGDSIWSREDLRRAGLPTRLTHLTCDVQLTPRESEVITHMVEGLTNKEIAVNLGISYETVKEHVQHILRKVGVSDRTQAAVWAVRQQLA
jgi:DNA-binding NarL/FixJ family response regulator